MNVFYMPEQVAANPHAYSPSASKPALVVADWLQRGLISAADIRPFEPVGRADFKRVHDAAFVDGVLDLERNNGFGNRDAAVAASLPFTTGSLLAAARHALARREAVCSPTSGFHHAGCDGPEGFCTFNGLMVTVARLLADNAVHRVAILDCDVHYGNGSDEIIERLGLGPRVIHHTMGQHFHSRTCTRSFARWLSEAIADCRGADLVLYQAGADPHVRDPLGGLLTEREMLQRDRAVFEGLAGLPLVWNLAGGYQRDARGGIGPVLRLHRNTAQACLAVERRHNAGAA